MNFSSTLLENAVQEFSRLPGIGRKTAIRLVLHLLKQEKGYTDRFAQAIQKMGNEICYCPECNNVSDSGLCHICTERKPTATQLCVVESIRDVMALEATQQFNGVYHILGGLISPLEGIGPDELRIDSLIQRIEAGSFSELILAISPTLEGDTTSFYISRKLGNHPIRITTLSRGVAFGGELEYADELTLTRSLQSRLPVERFVSPE
ncbi:MAG TPA: recombination mediator RecR [Chitinophagaceae bacterium]|nr:recombination mediator RecR [Chitinophagaceae bacterium]HNF72063.1 recombination mediator RecR [Chitinophagaceae bacterium]